MPLSLGSLIWACSFPPLLWGQRFYGKAHGSDIRNFISFLSQPWLLSLNDFIKPPPFLVRAVSKTLLNNHETCRLSQESACQSSGHSSLPPGYCSIWYTLTLSSGGPCKWTLREACWDALFFFFLFLSGKQ